MKSFCLKMLIFIIIRLLSLCLMLTLITFCPFDDTYFQFTGNDFVYNAFGSTGALLSDILFFMFGFMAYLLPCMLFFFNWICLFTNNFLTFFQIGFKIFACILLLLSLCALVEYFVDDFYYCYSGGIVGSLLRSRMLYYMFNDIIVNIMLLIFSILGIVLIFKNDNHEKKLLLRKKIFLYLDIKLRGMISTLNMFKGVFVLDAISNFLVKIGNCNILKNKRIQPGGILYGMFFFVNQIINNIKYMCNIFMFTPVGKYCGNDKDCYILRFIRCNFYCGLFHRKAQVFDINVCGQDLSNNVRSCIKCKSYHQKCNDISHFMLMPSHENRILTSDSLDTKKHPSVLRETNTIGPLENSLKFFEKSSKLFPNVDLLSIAPFVTQSLDLEIAKKQSKLLELKLSEYHIQARVVNVLRGPVITRFELDLAPGLKSSRISSLSKDLARSLSVCALRIIEVIPGKPYIGLEIPNEQREMIYLREIIDSDIFRSSCSVLTLGFGKDVSGDPVVVDLINMPHLLIAGTTGSGKSVGINSMIVSMLYKASPESVRFIMIDSKILELSIYEGIPHLVTNVVTDINDIIEVLDWCVKEMDRRYKIMAHYNARNLASYNNRVKSVLKTNQLTSNESSVLILEPLPYLVIIIDEFADLVMLGGKEVESLIIRLSQKSRACGIHLILATQRPSVNVITGLIKANIPSRIAFTVSSKIDSRTILDQSGAESLLGMGDMLYLSSQSFIPIRLHGAFVSDEEISLIVQHWKSVVNK